MLVYQGTHSQREKSSFESIRYQEIRVSNSQENTKKWVAIIKFKFLLGHLFICLFFHAWLLQLMKHAQLDLILFLNILIFNSICYHELLNKLEVIQKRGMVCSIKITEETRSMIFLREDKFQTMMRAASLTLCKGAGEIQWILSECSELWGRRCILALKIIKHEREALNNR